MKNLNITKWLYSMCAVLFFLTCSLTSKAQIGSSRSDPDTLTLGFGTTNPYETDRYEQAFYTSGSGFVDSLGLNGNECWFKITLTSACYLTVNIGSTTGDFDTFLRLRDASDYEIDSNDYNPYGGPTCLTSRMDDYLSAGVYWVILEGTSRAGHDANGGANMIFSVSQ